MPLFVKSLDQIAANLRLLARGDRAPMIAIGCFTAEQFSELNRQRAGASLHLLLQNEILFIGRHLYNSRIKDGYSIEDIVRQIESAMATSSIPQSSEIATYMQNPAARDDGYGNLVHDRAVFEMTSKKPKAELYSVMPKGDHLKPPKN